MNQIDTIKQMKSDLQADIASLVRQFERKSGALLEYHAVVVKIEPANKTIIERTMEVDVNIQNPFENE